MMIDHSITLNNVYADFSDPVFFLVIINGNYFSVVDGNKVAGFAILLREADFEIDSEPYIRVRLDN